MTESKRILEMVGRLRTYASFWEWPDKTIKERGIMRDFLQARSHAGLKPYKSVVAQLPDPPDFRATELSGKLIGIELTELVSEDAIRANIVAKTPEQRVYRDWMPRDFAEALQKRLDDKDAKEYHDGPYDGIDVVIFTDEPTVTYVGFGDFLVAHAFRPPKQIHCAYMLFSYDPGMGYCPLVELNFGS